MAHDIKMKTRITYFVHGSTPGNKKCVATSWENPGLSELCQKQALQLKGLIKTKFDAVFCSDLKRAVQTTMIALTKTPIADKRLRECNYGDLSGKK